ncbi:MAG: SulP family inorganic anion transporter [Bacteroidota bacterium]
MSPNPTNFLKETKHDIPAGLVVFLVALPLCLGIALASGAPLFAGIIAGIVGGTVVALSSGSQLGVSGPAAGLVVIVLAAIQSLGYEAFLLAVLIGGLIQLTLGFLKAGFVAYFFPTSVIKGMLAAIGIIIFLKQIPHAFGYDGDFEGNFAFLQADGQNTFTELGNMFNHLGTGAIIVSVLSLGILILWERPFMKKQKWVQFMPGALMVVITGITLNAIFTNFAPSLAIKAEHLVKLPVAGNFSEFIGQFTLPDFSAISNPEVWVTAIVIAAVASIETLLTSEATDKLDPYKRITPTNRELKAQGLGNFVSGLIGGLPITQVIVRSSANIQAGGRTKFAAFYHGIFLLACVALIPSLLNLIPLASLAAVLILVGYKLARPALFKQMYNKGIMQFAPFVITIVAIIFTDLLVGIGIGIVAAIFFILRHNFITPYFFEQHEDEGVVTLTLAEEVSFLNKAAIRNALSKMPDEGKVIIDGSRSVYIDMDVVEEIRDFVLQAQHKGLELELRGFKGMENTQSNTAQDSAPQDIVVEHAPVRKRPSVR